uniref:Core-binding (CB) domain-containing protein n=1 Tax=Trichogramma kaykai TaxID=54128 RepID=A0ABD2XM74_9HYME
MSKRQRIEEEVKLLEDRRKALEQQLLHENEEEELDESEVSSGRSSSVDSPSESESETDTAPSEPKKRKKGETPLKPALLEVLGDPEASRNLRLPINSKLIECWKIFMAKGLPAEEKEKIFKRYQVAEGLDAPKLNEALIPRLPEKTTKKDAYRQEVQSLISLALSTLSAAITMINEADAEDGLDEKVFTGRLMDTAKLLAEAQFSQTQSRRACIVPVFDKKLRQTLKDTTPDDRLFGTDLTNLIKQVKDTEALFDCSSKRAGNFKSAFEKKTPLSAQSGTGASTQGRARLFFRGSRGRNQNRNRSYNSSTYQSSQQYPSQKPEKSTSKSKAFGSSGRDHIREAFKALKVPTESLDIMLASLSVSTRKHYKASIARWLIFCEENSLNIYKAKPRDLINFLTERFRQGCSYSTLNSDRSAISLIAGNIGEDRLVCRFLKGCFRLRPIQTRFHCRESVPYFPLPILIHSE